MEWLSSSKKSMLSTTALYSSDVNAKIPMMVEKHNLRAVVQLGLECNLFCWSSPVQVIRMVGESTEAVGAGVGGSSSSNKMPTLEEYGTNLTKLAEEVRKIPPSGVGWQNWGHEIRGGRRGWEGRCMTGNVSHG